MGTIYGWIHYLKQRPQSEISFFAGGGFCTTQMQLKVLALELQKATIYVTFLNQVENNGVHIQALMANVYWTHESIMTMLGAKNIDDLTQKQIVFSRKYCMDRTT